MEAPDPFLAPPTAPTPDARPVNVGFRGFGDDGPSFLDVLDIVNPLQHIPVVSTIYRALTGDGIDHVPRIAGGALFGGLIGGLTALVNVIVDELTGSDIGEHVLGWFDDLFDASGPAVMAGGKTPLPAFPVGDNGEFASPPVEPVMAAATQRYADTAALDAPVAGDRVDVLG